MENAETLYVVHAIEDTNYADYMKIMFDTFYSDFCKLTPRGIPGGANWQKEVSETLPNATSCVILLSKAYHNSAPALWETMLAIDLNKPILVVIIANTIVPPLLIHFDVFDATADPDDDWTKRNPRIYTQYREQN